MKYAPNRLTDSSKTLKILYALQLKISHLALLCDEGKRRVLPITSEIRKRSPDAVISIDTYKAEVTEKVIEAGTKIIKDISGLKFDGKMKSVAKKHIKNAEMRKKLAAPFKPPFTSLFTVLSIPQSRLFSR